MRVYKVKFEDWDRGSIKIRAYVKANGHEISGYGEDNHPAYINLLENVSRITSKFEVHDNTDGYYIGLSI
jgi:hypothetical protein